MAGEKVKKQGEGEVEERELTPEEQVELNRGEIKNEFYELMKTRERSDKIHERFMDL